MFRDNMLNLVITWFLFDVVALILLIYDYRRWYGQTNHILEDPNRYSESLIASWLF
jgi:hypothetical protein